MIFVVGVIAVPQSDSASNTDYPEIDFLPSPSDCHLYACLVMICFEALVIYQCKKNVLLDPCC